LNGNHQDINVAKVGSFHKSISESVGMVLEAICPKTQGSGAKHRNCFG